MRTRSLQSRLSIAVAVGNNPRDDWDTTASLRPSAFATAANPIPLYRACSADDGTHFDGCGIGPEPDSAVPRVGYILHGVATSSRPDWNGGCTPTKPPRVCVGWWENAAAQSTLPRPRLPCHCLWGKALVDVLRLFPS
jgi:hypothetical protein